MLSPAKMKLLQEELAAPVLDDYTAAVMARRDIEQGNVGTALSRLRVDGDKFRMVAPLLYALMTGYFEELAASSAEWTRPTHEPSSTERMWRHT